MIEKNRGVFLFIIILLVLGIGLYVIWLPDSPPMDEVSLKIRKSSPESSLPMNPKDEVIMKEGRKVLGLTKGPNEARDLTVSNKPSPKWEEGLRQAVSRQGGNSLKDIKVIKEDSFIWVHAGIGLNVESVVVTLKDHKNQETTFRALVDSQTGKILQTWDWPIIDEFVRSEDSGVALDPRYLGQ